MKTMNVFVVKIDFEEPNQVVPKTVYGGPSQKL